MQHSDCCAALALTVLGQIEMARIESQLCEWGQLQRAFDEPTPDLFTAYALTESNPSE